MDIRLFVRKKANYALEEIQLKQSIIDELHISIKTVAIYNIYDIFNIDSAILNQAKQSVFSEVMVDDVFEQIALQPNHYFAFETLPTQYDQRADSAMQCLSLLDNSTNCTIRTGKVVVFDRALSHDELQKIEQFLVNPIEARVKDLTILTNDFETTVKPLEDLSGFITGDNDFLLSIKHKLSLAMSLEDLIFIQHYFQQENREPTETEIYVLDCYWSDHCRHTTFETILDDITIESALFREEMQQAMDCYLDYKKHCSHNKPVTLMDMASVIGKFHKNVLKDEAIEVSEEINACSFFTTLTLNGKEEKWLIQFKNETHNHPTEIEPFGGASTCIGGAIRDPLSGRSFVYQAMRISGSGNILQKREDTLAHKLPQKQIALGAAHGNSSYGNQIGLATTFVKELYDDSYVAKHLEVGAVVGAVRHDNYKRESVKEGDIVVVIGGRTGRDGIQGASGSSVEHTNESLVSSSSQVQKGNAVEERKIQRLFRQPNVSKMIKKCNDFGAGGVCVAIGELAAGIDIHLDKMLVKYQGLNATEIATSESQERMAVVIDANDYEAFISACQQENIEYAHVATVTNRNRLVMYYFGEKVVDMSAEFLETSGVRQHAKATLVDHNTDNPFTSQPFTQELALKDLSSLNVACQKGLVSMFDSSIGSSTVLMPLSGKYQMTPVQASVQSLPTLNGISDTATILTYGFIPKLSHYSPFISAIYAVLESVAKVYAVGGTSDNIYFSFQEYFEKLGKDSKKWGKVTQALLGSIYAQHEIGRPSIGGKDSMSGTFNDLSVVDTLMSFACCPVKVADVITPELKHIGNKLYYIPVVKDDKGFPNIKETLRQYKQVRQYIQEKKIVSVYVQETGTLFSHLVKMALGNRIGFTVNSDELLHFNPCSLIVEATDELPFNYIGEVTPQIMANDIVFTFDQVEEAYTTTLDDIYPIYVNKDKGACDNVTQTATQKRYFNDYVEDVTVVIPVFPGTNCEYDTTRAFEQAGATVKTVVIRNKQQGDIEQSIDEFVEAIEQAHIICFAGGFSSGDEPDGSAKFIVNVLHNQKVKQAISNHIAQQKLILGICNGFQALIKSGLLPYGEIKPLQHTDLTLYRNDCNRHISTTAMTRVANTTSPWTQDFTIDDIHEVVFSHGEGKLVGESIEQFKHLTAFQYCDFNGQATLNGQFNPNGSEYAIEGMISENGLILGKMGHSERYHDSLYKTHTIKKYQHIFSNGVNYFKKGDKHA